MSQDPVELPDNVNVIIDTCLTLETHEQENVCYVSLRCFVCWTHCSGELMSFRVEASLSLFLFVAQIWASWVTDPTSAASREKCFYLLIRNHTQTEYICLTLRASDDYRVCLSSDAETSPMSQKAPFWGFLFPHPAANKQTTHIKSHIWE